MIDEITRIMSEKIDRQFMNMCLSGSTGTFSNQQEQPLTRETLLESMAELERCKPAPPPIRVYENIHLTEAIQYRFPKKRKNRRWVKKFEKKYTKTVPSRKIYFDQHNNNVYCHPEMMPVIKEVFKSNKTLPVNMPGALGSLI